MSDTTNISVLKVGFIRLDIENLYHYANFTEKSLKTEVEEINAFIKVHGTQPSVDEEWWNVSEVFPHLHRSAVLLSVFAFFEHNLNVVCDSLAQEHDKLLRVSDLHGRGLKRAKIYLSKEIGIIFPSESESWRELSLLQKLRNVVAHRDGLLKEDDKELKMYIEKSYYVSIDSTGHVRLKEGILTHLLQHLEWFFIDLGTAISAQEQTT